MEQFNNIIIVGLASFRLAMMIAEEEGPFSIFTRLRSMLGAYDTNQYGVPRSIWGRGISCPLCVGMYTSFVFYTLSLFHFGFYIVLWFSVAGIQVLVHALFKGMQHSKEESE